MRRVFWLLILGSFLLFAQKSAEEIPGSLAPYLPTPMSVVDEMLKAAQLKAFETLYDLGSGDGRIVIQAAQKYKANAIGVELDDALAASSTEKIANLGLSKVARIIHGDLLDQDYSSADVITVYLWPEANAKVARMLEGQLKKGARVVSHDFEMRPWKPSSVITIPDDGTGRSHMLYIYIR
jgi:hypothetical protein